MKTQPFPAIVLDADAILRRFRLPYWALARIRSLRVEEELLLVDFEAPGFLQSTASASVSLTRERGGVFRLDAGWLAHLGANAQRRGHLWAWVEFKLLPNRQIELVQRDSPDLDNRRASLRLVEIVMRRAALLGRWAKADGDKVAYRAMCPEFFMTRRDTETGALEWLEPRRGPTLIRSVHAALRPTNG